MATSLANLPAEIRNIIFGLIFENVNEGLTPRDPIIPRSQRNPDWNPRAIPILLLLIDPALYTNTARWIYSHRWFQLEDARDLAGFLRPQIRGPPNQLIRPMGRISVPYFSAHRHTGKRFKMRLRSARLIGLDSTVCLGGRRTAAK